MKKTLERKEFLQKNNLKLIKCSPENEAVNYKKVFPDTQEDINQLLHLQYR